MIIYKNIDSVWINTSEGVTVYFHYNEVANYMMAYVRTECGVSQHTSFGKCKSIEDGRSQLESFNQQDANRIFQEILGWDGNRDYGIENFLSVSHEEPLVIKKNNT